MNTVPPVVKDHFSTYDYGYKGRERGVPFDVHQTPDWKRGWLTRDEELRDQAALARLQQEERIAYNQRMFAERIITTRAQYSLPQDPTDEELLIVQKFNEERLAKKAAQQQRQRANQAERTAECQRLKTLRNGRSGGGEAKEGKSKKKK